eukprot:CAMPEP_0197841566 /NCGR_PEP_ID=MMETSP1437-20131217/46256_1 /TAXON_ID=49252 ORGANISM="Eucampia antarctica, Strain CCMP1452" /NCGR_SAMPLE_ID=MMETSP1437 /ASSEMBLY_ACC=CAM_ASM_001096 /LENGTH=157 /DNA_ID=CAMNT_0043451347 /DNA_START=1109 /DNA_END=1579 /DNA_ORIENTATION=+
MLKARCQVISLLKKNLAAVDPWRELILGAEDEKIAYGASDFDREHVVKKTRHIIDALHVMTDHTAYGQPLTWNEACVKASHYNYNCIGWRTIMMRYLDVHTTTTGDLRFTKSCRGSSSAETISPFAEDESLLIQFKSWARCDLEHLTIKRVSEWVND